MSMELMTLKAATTAADQGTFTAVISSASVDREKDIVNPQGMVAALRKWVPTGKKIPLAWMHSAAAADQIGHIDPASVRVQGKDVIASGWIDQSTEVGAHAWRLVKAGTLGFSFGYLTLKATPRKGGGRQIDELDVFEITATTVPMNNDTRVLSHKQMSMTDRQGMAKRMQAMADMMAADSMPMSEAECAAKMRAMADEMAAAKAIEETQTEETGRDATGKALRRRADQIAFEHVVNGQKLPSAEEMAKAVSDGGGTDRMLESMLAQAQEFIDTDPDADDRAAMEQIVALLHEMQAEEVDDVEEQGGEESTTTTGKALRRRAEKLELEHVSGGIRQRPRQSAPAPDLPPGADWLFPEHELAAARTGELKAVWTTAYVNSLPDSSFLHIEDGGTKDSEGKTTPRSLRHFPVKDANGNIDMAHLRNALARIPQSSLPQSVKDRCTAAAQRMLNAQTNKSVDETDREPGTSRFRSVDPLRAQADRVELAHLSGGESLRKPPPEVKTAPKPEPQLELDELRRQMREITLTALSGGLNNE